MSAAQLNEQVHAAAMAAGDASDNLDEANFLAQRLRSLDDILARLESAEYNARRATRHIEAALETVRSLKRGGAA